MRPETRLEALTSQIGATAWALADYLAAAALATYCKVFGHDVWIVYPSLSRDDNTYWTCKRCSTKWEKRP